MKTRRLAARRAAGSSTTGLRQRPANEAILAERLALTGIDPKLIGERVIDAIRTRTFYALVSGPRDLIKARHRRIAVERLLAGRRRTSLILLKVFSGVLFYAPG